LVADDKSGGEIFERGGGSAVDDDPAKAKCLGGYELELLYEVVDGMRWGAHEAVFATDETEQQGQLKVAQGVDLVEKAVIRHDSAVQASILGP
jgi:hypothetical protein